MVIHPSVHTFTTDNIQLDHLEANKLEELHNEKYFKPVDPNERRETYVNGIGNFMILDGDNNIEKGNEPLSLAISHYDNMCQNHWLVQEIRDMLSDKRYSEFLSIGDEMFYKPNEMFFNERRARLTRYFEALLDKKLSDTEMPLS